MASTKKEWLPLKGMHRMAGIAQYFKPFKMPNDKMLFYNDR